MKIFVLFMLLFYYAVLSLFILLPGSPVTGLAGYDTSNLTGVLGNNSELQAGEIDTGGLFGTGISFGRYFSMITIGVGLPDDTPTWFTLMFFIWQSIVLIIAVSFVISSIWDG